MPAAIRSQCVKTSKLIATLFIFSLCGCARLQVKLGLRVDIAKLPVASMDAHLQGDPGVAPGEKSPLIATFAQPDGTVLTTTGAGKGKVRWSDLVVTPTLVSVNNPAKWMKPTSVIATPVPGAMAGLPVADGGKRVIEAHVPSNKILIFDLVEGKFHEYPPK